MAKTQEEERKKEEERREEKGERFVPREQKGREERLPSPSPSPSRSAAFECDARETEERRVIERKDERAPRVGKRSTPSLRIIPGVQKSEEREVVRRQ